MQYEPETKLLSSNPSFLSNNMAPEVSATDKKKIILKQRLILSYLSLLIILYYNYYFYILRLNIAKLYN